MFNIEKLQRTFLFITCAFLFTSSVFAQESSSSLYFQTIEYPSPELIDLIAEIGVEENVVIPENETTLKHIYQKCGSLDLTYIDRFISHNKIDYKIVSERMDSEKMLSFPACIRPPVSTSNKTPGAQLSKPGWSFEASKDFGITSSIAESLKNEVSKRTQNGDLISDDVFKTEFELQKILVDEIYKNQEDLNSDLDTLLTEYEGVQFTSSNSTSWDLGASQDYYGSLIPYTPSIDTNLLEYCQIPWEKSASLRSYSAGTHDYIASLLNDGTLSNYKLPSQTRVAVKNMFNDDIEKYLDLIRYKYIETGGAAENILNDEFGLVSYNNFDYDASECVFNKRRASDWPFEFQKLSNAIFRNKYESQFETIPTITVVDTGVDLDQLSETSLDNDYRAKYRFIRGQAARKTASGFNVVSRENTAKSTKRSLNDRFHGLAVFGAALGTSQLESLRNVVKLPIRASAVSIVDPSTGKLGIERIGDALLHLEAGIQIVNLSLYHTQPIPPIVNALKAVQEKTLVIVAAGNERKTFEEKRIYPAMYGGSVSNNSGATVITVGAHGPEGKPLSFTRLSADYVDILAPGCGVPTLSMSEDASGNLLESKALHNGTSLSAPIVSFVSALLASKGLSPREIKKRLIVSAEFNPLLEGKVYSKGTLNAARALEVDHDVLTLHDGTMFIGKVNNSPTQIIKVAGEEFEVSQLAKLSTFVDTTTKNISKMHLITVNDPVTREKLEINKNLTDISGVSDFPEIEFAVKYADETGHRNEIRNFSINEIADLTRTAR